MTEEQVLALVDVHNTLQEMVVDAVRRYYAVCGRKQHVSAYATLVVDDYGPDEIGLRWEETWRYGGHETVSESVPLSYLWDPNWEADLAKKIEDERAEAAAAEEQRRAEAAAERDEREKREWRRLSKKYGSPQ